MGMQAARGKMRWTHTGCASGADVSQRWATPLPAMAQEGFAARGVAELRWLRAFAGRG